MDGNKKIILFGAGAFGKKALEYFGGDRVAFYADNNAVLAGSLIHGKKVLSFEEFKMIQGNYKVVISVDARKLPALAAQLEENGVTGYEVYLDMVHHLKKPSVKGNVSWLEICEKAAGWIGKYTEAGKGIFHSSKQKMSYPEVTGYYIPTLMRWGFSEKAVACAEWLCSIQHPDGSWYDMEGRDIHI